MKTGQDFLDIENIFGLILNLFFLHKFKGHAVHFCINQYIS